MSAEAFITDRDTIAFCRKIGRLQAALDNAIIQVEVYALPELTDWRRDQIVALVADMKAAIRESEQP